MVFDLSLCCFDVRAAGEPGDARWADEFARKFAQGLDFGSEAALEAAWQEQVGSVGAWFGAVRGV